MANNLPTRMCDGCGQVWASGAFLDPTATADCEFCGGNLVHRRRLPESASIGLSLMSETAVELEHLSVGAAVSSTNGARAPVA